MAEHEAEVIRVRAPDGKLLNLLVREKCRQTEDGVEGTLYTLLHPKTLFEIGEYWAPLANSD